MPGSPPEFEESSSRLDLVLRCAGMGLWELDLRMQQITFDERSRRLLGLSPAQTDMPFADFLASLDSADQEHVRQKVEEAGGSGAELHVEARIHEPITGTTRTCQLRANLVRDAEGQPLRLSGVCMDVTDQHLNGSLVSERHMLKTLMQNLPDMIYFKDLESRFISVNSAMAERVGVANPADLIGKTDYDVFANEHAVAAHADEQRIIQTGAPVVNEEEKETWPDGRATWVSTTKMALRDESGRTVGTFGLSRDITARKLAQEELARLAEELRFKNQALEEDLEMARELQNALLPHHYPCFPHSASTETSALRFHHFYNPSMAVSGDFFDVLDISDTMAGTVICDVMGHGVRAALVASIIRALIGELRPVWADPGEFLTQLNIALRRILQNAGIAMFATAFYVVVDMKKGELRYANAGHPHPLHVRHNGVAADPHPLNGCKPEPVIGMFDHATYTTTRTPLTAHDVLLLFTDGLFEVEGTAGQPYDYPALMQAVGRRGNLPILDLCREVVSEVQQFSASKDFTDDVCLVAVEVDRLLPLAQAS